MPTIANRNLLVSEISLTLVNPFDINGHSRTRRFAISGKVVGGVVTATAPAHADEYDLADIAIALRAMGFEAVVFTPSLDEVRAGIERTIAAASSILSKIG